MEKDELVVADIIRMAVTMEEKGMDFYTWAAGRFKDQAVNTMFLRLAEEEKDHARQFRKLLEYSGEGRPINRQQGKYFQALAGVKAVFPHHQEITEDNIKTPADVLSVGIQAEKDSILLYHELYNRSESQELKDALSKLLEEEKMHLIELRDSMDELEG